MAVSSCSGRTISRLAPPGTMTRTWSSCTAPKWRRSTYANSAASGSSRSPSTHPVLSDHSHNFPTLEATNKVDCGLRACRGGPPGPVSEDDILGVDALILLDRYRRGSGKRMQTFDDPALIGLRPDDSQVIGAIYDKYFAEVYR